MSRTPATARAEARVFDAIIGRISAAERADASRSDDIN